jgi:hypothetical protein
VTATHAVATTAGNQVNGLILTLRSTPVLIDVDLAELYGVTTKALNQAVQRNIERFPQGFKFQLTREEKDELVTNCDRFKNLKHSSALPHAFTEQGVAMLSSILHSEIAIDVNIAIMRAFVMMRQWALNHHELTERLNALEQQYGQKFKDIEQALSFLIQKDKNTTNQQQRNRIGFKK